MNASRLTTNVDFGNMITSISLPLADNYTFSCYAKADVTNVIALRSLNFDSSPTTYFELDGNGSVYSTGAIEATIENVGNGWYRCTHVFNTASDLIGNVRFQAANSINYLAKAGNAVLIYQAQLEQGSYATSQITTQGATVTRLKDAGDVEVEETTEISWFLELTNNVIRTRDAIGGGLILDKTLGGKTNGLEISNTNGTDRFSISKYIGATPTIIYTTLTDECKILLICNGTVLNGYINGVQIITNESFAIENMKYLQLDCIDQPYNIKQNHTYNEILTDAQAIDLTTI
jgi:hypothetical protein